jgi:hypothetical protein
MKPVSTTYATTAAKAAAETGRPDDDPNEGWQTVTKKNATVPKQNAKPKKAATPATAAPTAAELQRAHQQRAAAEDQLSLTMFRLEEEKQAAALRERKLQDELDAARAENQDYQDANTVADDAWVRNHVERKAEILQETIRERQKLADLREELMEMNVRAAAERKTADRRQRAESAQMIQAINELKAAQQTGQSPAPGGLPRHAGRTQSTRAERIAEAPENIQELEAQARDLMDQVPNTGTHSFQPLQGGEAGPNSLGGFFMRSAKVSPWDMVSGEQVQTNKVTKHTTMSGILRTILNPTGDAGVLSRASLDTERGQLLLYHTLNLVARQASGFPENKLVEYHYVFMQRIHGASPAVIRRTYDELVDSDKAAEGRFLHLYLQEVQAMADVNVTLPSTGVKGKGKGKGNGKGKGKGGQSKFDGTCHKCGKTGHKQHECKGSAPAEGKYDN